MNNTITLSYYYVDVSINLNLTITKEDVVNELGFSHRIEYTVHMIKNSNGELIDSCEGCILLSHDDRHKMYDSALLLTCESVLHIQTPHQLKFIPQRKDEDVCGMKIVFQEEKSKTCTVFALGHDFAHFNDLMSI